MNYNFEFSDFDELSIVQIAKIKFANIDWTISFIRGEVVEMLYGENDGYIDQKDAHKLYLIDSGSYVTVEDFINDLENNYDTYVREEIQDIKDEEQYREDVRATFYGGKL